MVLTDSSLSFAESNASLAQAAVATAVEKLVEICGVGLPVSQCHCYSRRRRQCPTRVEAALGMGIGGAQKD